MRFAAHDRRPLGGVYCRITVALLAIIVGLFAGAAQAQTYTVLHTFGGTDGSGPQAGLTMDRAGNLYGTTVYGGTKFQGNVFKLTRRNSSWIFTNLYSFQGGTDGANPEGRVVLAADGSLYGSTNQGGNQQCGYGNGCGTIFRLQPPARACASAQCPWTETVIYRFDGSNGAGFPQGEMAFDQQGNLYGTAGYTYQLSPTSGGWTMSLLSLDHYASFGVTLDAAGNVYGADYDANNVFELSPSPSGWVARVLYTLNDGSQGYGLTSLVFDQAGNLYGGNSNSGPNGSGTVYQLSPSNGGWALNLLYGFSGDDGYGGPDEQSLLVDPAGTVYGTALFDGANNVGSIFQLTPSNGGWTYTDLHDFIGHDSGGCYPNDSMVRDAEGNLYGTTSLCGAGSSGNGVVFEITP
ncbi:MAG: choice-of-anchor tandem repeat GloVer-containing protein [Candidatus Korobacteraceae bacterium]